MKKMRKEEYLKIVVGLVALSGPLSTLFAAERPTVDTSGHATTQAVPGSSPSSPTDAAPGEAEPTPPEPDQPLEPARAPLLERSGTLDSPGSVEYRQSNVRGAGVDAIQVLGTTSPQFGLDTLTDSTARQRRYRIRPHLTIAGTYDSNIFANDEGEKGDFIITAAPGLTLNLGTQDSRLYLETDYTAAFNYFVDESGANSIDHHFRLELRSKFDKLSLGLRLGFESLNGADVDVGDRVRRNNYYVGITSEYEISPKLSLELNADYTLSDYNELLDSTEVRVQGFINYLVQPKLRLGIGGTIGILQVDDSPNQTYEEALIRVGYEVTQRLSISANAGVDFRQFDGGRGNSNTPVFGLGIAWTPFDGTTLSLDGRRRIYGSAALERQNYTATGVTLSARQRIATDYLLSLSVGYENAEYSETTADQRADREDNFVFIRPGVQWQIKEWCTLGLYYTFSTNLSSGEQSNDFTREQISFQATFTF